MRRLTDAWEVVEHTSAAVRVLPFRLPGRALRDFYTVSVLDCVLGRTPRIFDLMGLIEEQLGGVPSEADGLAPNGRPQAERQGPRIKVELTSDPEGGGRGFTVVGHGARRNDVARNRASL